MLLQTVPASRGLQWALQGIKTFWRQPLAMTGLFLMFTALISFLSALPWVGALLALTLMPAFTAGLMVATQIAQEGHFPMPSTLWVALRLSPQRRAMLRLGLLYASGFTLLTGMSILIDGGQFARFYLGDLALSSELAHTDNLQSGLWLIMGLYVPLSMLFWHAPALVFWQQVPPVKSLFFSWMACWRNKSAFVVYVLCWSLMFCATAVVALTTAAVLGDAQMTGSILMPLALLVAAMFFTSMLFTVKDCLSVSESQMA